MPTPFARRARPLLMAGGEAAYQLAAAIAGAPKGRRLLETDPARAVLVAAAEARGRTPFALASPEAGDAEVDPRAGYVIADGVAVIAIRGPLWDTGYRDYETGAVWWHGYDTIREAVALALADTRVRGILLSIDSPGGLVDGCARCADAIRAARARKPVWAHASYAASAAYWLASQAEMVVLDPDGTAGSIGVIVLHWSYADMLKADGIAVTPILFGARKADGHPEIPLGKSARADIQADVDEIGRRFVAGVVGGRDGAIDRASVLATEARVYMARHADPSRSALKRGLVDDLAEWGECLAAFQAHVSQADPGPEAPSARAQSGGRRARKGDRP